MINDVKLGFKMINVLYCHKYQAWTEEDWCGVMFSDESTFKLIRGVAGVIRVRRRKGSLERYKHCLPNNEHLRNLLNFMWCMDLTQKLLLKLARSMPNRIAKCLANDGGHTEY